MIFDVTPTYSGYLVLWYNWRCDQFVLKYKTKFYSEQVWPIRGIKSVFVCERVGSIFYYNAPLKNDEISSFFLVEQNLRDSMNHLQKIVWNASETFHFHSWHVCCKNGHPKIFFRFHKSLFFSDSDSDLTIYGSLSFLKKILFGKFDNF